MSALFPNVPIAQGVPAVARSLLFPADNEPTELLRDSGAEVNADTARQWGLFDQDGEFVAPADNVVNLEIGLDARISDYPVENGGFASYNKTLLPFEARMVMTRGGSVDDRQEFLKAVQDAWQSTDLYNIVTPEGVYLDVNVTAVRQTRAADRGVGLMALELSMRQIRQTAKLAFTNSKEPSGAGQVNAGAVQAQPTERGIDPAELQPR